MKIDAFMEKNYFQENLYEIKKVFAFCVDGSL